MLVRKNVLCGSVALPLLAMEAGRKFATAFPDLRRVHGGKSLPKATLATMPLPLEAHPLKFSAARFRSARPTGEVVLV